MHVVIVVASVLGAYFVGGQTGLEAGGLFGIAIAVGGMLGSAPYVLAMDGLGSIADTAGGIIEMTVAAERPDVRGKVTHALTGLAPGASRHAPGDFQAELVQRVLDAGDITLEAWEASFDAQDLATEGPRHEIWRAFRERFPWDDPDEGDEALLVWFLEQLLQERDGTSILTPLYVRSAIDVTSTSE